MTKISTSPDRHQFQKQNYLRRKLEEGTDPDDPDFLAMLEYLDRAAEMDQQQIQEPDWSQDNLEHDLRTTDWILTKVRASDRYAQNLYAAMCNNDFQKLAVMPILTDQTWSCSWRYAGGIIAHMRESGDYIDWYCSGRLSDGGPGSIYITNGYVSESVVTPEIRRDLESLGWRVITDQEE